MALKKSELYSSLWSGCDELRGGMDASQYKDYVLVMLFVKYVSDKYAGVPYAPITIPKGASFKDMAALKGKSDIGDQINKKILGPLAAANKLSDMPDFNDATKLGSGKEMVDRLTDAGLRSSNTRVLPVNCVLIGLAGQGRTRGTVAVNIVPLCTNQSIAAILPGSEFSSLYLYYHLYTRYDELRGLSDGGGGRGGLNLGIIRSLKVPFPLLEEQSAISAVLADIDEDIRGVSGRLAKARLIKTGMMQNLLTGRIRLV